MRKMKELYQPIIERNISTINSIKELRRLKINLAN
jgi:hypothetical protein